MSSQIKGKLYEALEAKNINVKEIHIICPFCNTSIISNFPIDALTVHDEIQTILNIYKSGLDMCRKEFPDYLMFDKEYTKNDPYITHQTWCLDSKNSFLKTERDKWFVKWFLGGDNVE